LSSLGAINLRNKIPLLLPLPVFLFPSFISFFRLFAYLVDISPLGARPRRSYALIAPGTRLRRKSRPFASLMQIKIVPETSLQRGSRRVIAQLAGCNTFFIVST